MGSAGASKHHPPPARPMKRDPSAELLENLNPNPNPNPCLPPDSCSVDPMDCGDGDEDEVLRTAAVLSREEVLRRRSRRLRRLTRYYKEQYWALLEEVKVRHRDYYWEFGKSPFVGEERESGGNEGPVEGSEERAKAGVGAVGLGFGAGDGGKKGERERERCGVSGCKAYAMPLTRFCHSHILLDGKQTLYKACSYVIKSAQSGQIICGKPVLRAAVPSLCPVHFQKAQKHVSQALKRAGLNVSSSSRAAPKFHIIIAEYARQIQAKRREALNASLENVGDIDEKIS